MLHIFLVFLNVKSVNVYIDFCYLLLSVMLAIANSVGTSQVFQWNVSSSSFTPVWSGDPCFLLEPFAIQQPAGTLYLLASVNANQTSSTFYQIARIATDSDFVPR